MASRVRLRYELGYRPLERLVVHRGGSILPVVLGLCTREAKVPLGGSRFPLLRHEFDGVDAPMTPKKDKIGVPFYTEGGFQLAKAYERNRKQPRYCALCGGKIAYDVEGDHCGRHVSPHAQREYKARQKAKQNAMAGA